MMTHSHVCPGVRLVEGTDHTDAVENLLSYGRRHLGPEARERIETLAASFNRSLRDNLPVDLHHSVTLQAVPEEHRTNVEALMRDLEVRFLDNRYNFLRMVNTEGIPRTAVEELLDEYCLSRQWVADPELPNIVARIVVRHLTQWELICLLHDRVRKAVASLREAADGRGALPKPALAALGRLIAFLRWVPYEWTEEVLLTFLDEVELPDKLDRLRLYTSVMRALFCRSRVQRMTVERLCRLLLGDFAGRVPAALQRLLRAVAISGGQDAWNWLEERTRTRPELYANELFIEIMTMIDKAGTARLLEERRDELADMLGYPPYLRLVALTGRQRDETGALIAELWEGASDERKRTLLRAVDELHCSRACSYLLGRIGKESTIGLETAMLDTIVAAGELERVIALPAVVTRERPILYYHVIDLLYRRLITDPVTFTHLRDYSLLSHFEEARDRIYHLYRILFRFRALLAALCRAARTAERTGIAEAFHVTARFLPSVEHDALRNLERQAGSPAAELHGEVREARRIAEEHWRESRDTMAELALILEQAPDLGSSRTEGIFGGKRRRFLPDKVLSREELDGFPEFGTTGERIEALRRLREKTGESVAMLQKRFLFTEWFVRRAPFALTEELPRMLERIRRGEELSFDTDLHRSEHSRKRLRHTFLILSECTKQGVYLTDVLLDYLRGFPTSEIPDRIRDDLTHRRSLIARGEAVYKPENVFDRHLVFTTFAHVYRYGKESMGQPGIIYLWLRYLEATERLKDLRGRKGWPALPPHPKAKQVIGPQVERMYRQQLEEAGAFYDFLVAVYNYYHPLGIRIRVIPNISYGLFCIAPIVNDIVRKGIHVSLAGISSRYCDDVNISEFSLSRDAIAPVKPYLFSTASNYGTLNHDRILVVVDGTMEPMDRHDPTKIRLPKAHRGYLNHIVAINYVRSRYGYGMEDPEREVASALRLSVRYVRNLTRTLTFRQVVRRLLLSFDAEELEQFQREAGTGRTYYSFAQWNPDGLGAWSGSRGYQPREVPCVGPRDVAAPSLVFASMNGFSREGRIPAFFDNSPETESPRIILGPRGSRLDTGWPHQGKGIVIDFPEGENR